MKKYFFAQIIFLLALIFTSCAQVDYSGKVEQVESYLSETHFQGAVLIARKNKIIFSKGYGLCNKKIKNSPEITPESTFEIGSITKVMTASCIMQLQEQKKLNVQDKLSKYFPEYSYGDEITLEMLLNMRSGLTDCLNSAENYFPKKVYHNVNNAINNGRQIEDGLVLKYFYDAPLLTKPDSTYFYCNTNYYLLAKIIEQVSGLSYQEYLQKNIFTPCKMSSANVEYQKTDVIGYDSKNKYTSIPSELMFGCGDVNASAMDLFKWARCFTGGKVVSKKSFKKMINTASYGYGINVQNGEIFHSGVTSCYNSYFTYYPETKITMVVLSNQPVKNCNTVNVSRKLYKILNDENAQKGEHQNEQKKGAQNEN